MLGQTGWQPAPRLPEPDPVVATGGQTAELPGTVVAVLVAPGDRVEAGQPLVVVEAMKMEHPAVVTGPGVVQAVLVEVGQFVPPAPCSWSSGRPAPSWLDRMVEFRLFAIVPRP